MHFLLPSFHTVRESKIHMRKVDKTNIETSRYMSFIPIKYMEGQIIRRLLRSLGMDQKSWDWPEVLQLPTVQLNANT